VRRIPNRCAWRESTGRLPTAAPRVTRLTQVRFIPAHRRSCERNQNEFDEEPYQRGDCSSAEIKARGSSGMNLHCENGASDEH